MKAILTFISLAFHVFLFIEESCGETKFKILQQCKKHLFLKDEEGDLVRSVVFLSFGVSYTPFPSSVNPLELHRFRQIDQYVAVFDKNGADEKNIYIGIFWWGIKKFLSPTDNNNPKRAYKIFLSPWIDWGIKMLYVPKISDSTWPGRYSSCSDDLSANRKLVQRAFDRRSNCCGATIIGRVCES